MPNALSSWPQTYADLCRALGSAIDCTAGCSPIRLAVTANGGGRGTAANAVRTFVALPARHRPIYPPVTAEHCAAAPASAAESFRRGGARGGGESLKASDGAWAVKTPHALFFLSFYHALLGPTFKFVHVVRDGRDLAFGPPGAASTSAPFDRLCPHMYGAERCSSEPRPDRSAAVARSVTL